MKTIKGLFILTLLAAAIVAGFYLGKNHGTEVKKVKAASSTATSSARDAVNSAVNTGKAMAGKLATNVSAATKEGMEKAGELATNVVAHTKVAASNVVNKVTDVTTNMVNEARKKLEGARN